MAVMLAKQNLSTATTGISASQNIGVVGNAYNHKILPSAWVIKVMRIDGFRMPSRPSLEANNSIGGMSQ